MEKHILELRDLALKEEPGIDLKLDNGDFCAVAGSAELLFDIIEGLAQPAAGTVLFDGCNWLDLTPAEECRHRSRITRVHPRQQAWIGNLSVRENIALRSIHHRLALAAEIEEAIDLMGKELGVGRDLEKRPEKVTTASLQMCQWIRAFLGAPTIVLLSDPEHGVSSRSADVLKAWVARLLEQGGIVIWALESGSMNNLHKSIKRPRAHISIDDNKITLERV